MYFVTTKREGYVLFAMTQSERAAMGLTEKQEVHLLARDTQANGWTVLARWKGPEFSHTQFMTAWHRRDEPADPADMLEVVPKSALIS